MGLIVGVLRGAAGAPASGHPRQPQDGNRAGRLLLILAEIGALGGNTRKELVAFWPDHLFGVHQEGLGTHLDGELRVGLHVVVPARVGRRPALETMINMVPPSSGKQARGDTRSVPDFAPM